MKIKEFKELSVSELVRREVELRQELLNLKVQKAGGQLDNPARIRLVRRAIARLQTLLSQQRLTSAK